MRRTVLHDLSFLAILRTMQINYYIFLEAKWRFAWAMSLINTNQTTHESYG